MPGAVCLHCQVEVTPRPLRRGFPWHGPARRRLRPRPPPHQAQVLATAITAKQLDVSVSRPVTLRVLPAAFGPVSLVQPGTAHLHASAAVNGFLSSPVWASTFTAVCGPLPSIPPHPARMSPVKSLALSVPVLDLSFCRQGPLPPCAPAPLVSP